MSILANLAHVKVIYSLLKDVHDISALRTGVIMSFVSLVALLAMNTVRK